MEVGLLVLYICVGECNMGRPECGGSINYPKYLPLSLIGMWECGSVDVEPSVLYICLCDAMWDDQSVEEGPPALVICIWDCNVRGPECGEFSPRLTGKLGQRSTLIVVNCSIVKISET